MTVLAAQHFCAASERPDSIFAEQSLVADVEQEEKEWARPPPLEVAFEPAASDLSPALPVSWSEEWYVALHPAVEALNRSLGADGDVAWLYTFGASAVASPILAHQKNGDGCFPGLRVFMSSSGWFHWADVAPWWSSWMLYAHAKQHVADIDVENTHEFHRTSCSDYWTRQPRGIDHLPNSGLHKSGSYMGSLYGELGARWMSDMSVFTDQGYTDHHGLVAEKARQKGWRLVGTSLHAGWTMYGSRLASHLLQHPATLECVITFQGSLSWRSWVQDLDYWSAGFCGLAEPDESCRFRPFHCKVRNERGAFVHGGHAERLVNQVKTYSWQHNIHRFLPSCSRVSAVGQSSGGGLASLFAACVSKAPKEGENGWHDYKWMGWTPGEPKILPWQ